MQTRAPPPNGKYENFGRASRASGVQRSGSKRSGSGNQRGSRCTTYGLKMQMDLAPESCNSADFEWLFGLPPDGPRRRIQPQGFRQTPFRRSATAAGRRTRGARPASTESISSMQPRFAFRILRQQIPGPGQRIRRGLVPGQKQRQRFIPHLFIGHAAPSFFVLRQQQHGEQVARILAALAPLADQPVNGRHPAAPAPFQSGGWRAAAASPDIRRTAS